MGHAEQFPPVLAGFSMPTPLVVGDWDQRPASLVLHFDQNTQSVRLMYTKRKTHRLAVMMTAATVGMLATGPLHSGSASAQSCKPLPPITHLAATAIAGRVYAGGGPLRRHSPCRHRLSLIGAGGTVTLATPSGHVIETYYIHAEGVYRFAVWPGLYVVTAYLNARETIPHCKPKTVRVRRHERKIVELGCNVP